ncbi:hypothetical protein AG1IA_09649 [Rhizoctonia solani AG-1 IA]|uniref:Uncharacterized protein n=1 Tax=Thanatephorus cucumeris (strain AG1-IA) TaxID=983506 RepID=L8WDT4_THACA|nr:hypothetical protein AG1IA_09649 [Rhizoctonia solani AG-1 IA]
MCPITAVLRDLVLATSLMKLFMMPFKQTIQTSTLSTHLIVSLICWLSRIHLTHFS